MSSYSSSAVKVNPLISATGCVPSSNVAILSGHISITTNIVASTPPTTPYIANLYLSKNSKNL